MDHGKFVALDTAPRLKDVLGGDVVSMEVESGLEAFLADVRGLEWIKQVRVHDEDVVNLTMDRGERRIPELVALAQEKGAVVSCVHLHKPSLEDVFLHFTGRTIRDNEVGAAERNRMMAMGPHGRR